MLGGASDDGMWTDGKNSHGLEADWLVTAAAIRKRERRRRPSAV